ncbi:hypothetical protein LOD99_3525 [Oopsacas minuta]|uniref:Uncharacterized protein n=1 Tax=Oopsacas minuta TaxID=111878 RepID=A0AAV7JYM6_9METZ|nr:hypothetical protein LOD99_3525 [Oopsacas minuta]
MWRILPFVSRTNFSTISQHQGQMMKRGLPKRKLIPNVDNIVVVASGKGGVGKSTIAVNLSHGLRSIGYRVGLLDVDIYGPSLPKMMNLNHKAETGNDGLILPLINYDIECMSMGFLVDSGIFWRGLMVMSAIETLLYKVKWSQRDVIVIDMPPGTGDTHISIVQRLNLTGAVIVTTPQDVALIDARKCVEMFSKVDVRVLGVVINMSGFVCENCGSHTDIFGDGNEDSICRDLDTSLLAKFPLLKDIRLSGDDGSCLLVDSKPNSIKQSITKMAKKVSVNFAPKN